MLGVEFVNGSGETIRGGGKVVKNVAGFDLSRLLTGSWGTLGVITEATLRLYARPAVDRTFVIDLGGPEKHVTSIVRAIVTSPLAPYALLLLSASAARSIGVGESPACLIRFGGNEAVVRAQVGALSQLSRPEELETKIWLAVRQLDGNSHSTIRISSLPQRVVAHAARMLHDAEVQLVALAGYMRVVKSPLLQPFASSRGQQVDAATPHPRPHLAADCRHECQSVIHRPHGQPHQQE